MIIEWYDGVGSIGVVLILAAYLWLQLEKLDPQALTYSAMNALGAFLILVSLYFDFNFSAALIESAWLIISLFGLAQAIRARK